MHHAFCYNAYGRLNMVSNGAQAALYGYLPHSDRLQTTAFHHSGSPVMATTRSWEWGERLQTISNTLNAQPSTLNCQFAGIGPLLVQPTASYRL